MMKFARIKRNRMIQVIQIEGAEVLTGFSAIQDIQMAHEIQTRRAHSIHGHSKNSNSAGSADAGDLGDLDLAD